MISWIEGTFKLKMPDKPAASIKIFVSFQQKPVQIGKRFDIISASKMRLADGGRR
ncbi:MAG: hypothetical protein HFE64_08705 [Lachnospiraceae bacterium]|jgi:hypothetical protein|nr:hypothetical protein [Lachnospiraceae bacterium]